MEAKGSERAVSLRRHSYSDPLPLLATALRHPSAWPRVLKARR